jgi:hypothetical protein
VEPLEPKIGKLKKTVDGLTKSSRIRRLETAKLNRDTRKQKQIA